MKIAIMGYSGSGKSTLARHLGTHFSLPVLHLDAVHHLPGWQARERTEEQQMVSDFLREHQAWVIDGNYSKLSFAQRVEEADQIILLLFSPLTCFFRAWRRSKVYRNVTRPDLAPGCPEKFDREFALWILFYGRSKAVRRRNREIIAHYPQKTVVIKNQRQLDRFYRSLEKLPTA